MPIQPIRPRAAAAALVSGRTVARVLTARGAIAGAFGAGSLALWFLLIDTVARTPLWSPSVVGRVLLTGAAPSSAMGVDVGVVAWFSLVHCALFVGFGIAATLALRAAGVRPTSLIGVGSLAVALHAGAVLGSHLLAPGLGDVLGWLYIGVGNVVAAISMSLCLDALPTPEDVERT
jgi:hypothetical protein